MGCGDRKGCGGGGTAIPDAARRMLLDGLMAARAQEAKERPLSASMLMRIPTAPTDQGGGARAQALFSGESCEGVPHGRSLSSLSRQRIVGSSAAPRATIRGAADHRHSEGPDNRANDAPKAFVERNDIFTMLFGAEHGIEEVVSSECPNSLSYEEAFSLAVRACNDFVEGQRGYARLFSRGVLPMLDESCCWTVQCSVAVGKTLETEAPCPSDLPQEWYCDKGFIAMHSDVVTLQLPGGCPDDGGGGGSGGTTRGNECTFWEMLFAGPGDPCYQEASVPLGDGNAVAWDAENASSPHPGV